MALAGGTFKTLNYLWKEKEQSVRADLKEYQKTVLEMSLNYCQHN